MPPEEMRKKLKKGQAVKSYKRKSVNEMRQAGIEGCKTFEGSEHYKIDEVEPVDLMAACGILEGYCLGSIIKYAFRFTKTKQQKDLAKIADCAHILYGYNREV